jgi:hypothetical protein
MYVSHNTQQAYGDFVTGFLIEKVREGNIGRPNTIRAPVIRLVSLSVREDLVSERFNAQQGDRSGELLRTFYNINGCILYDGSHAS